MDINRLVDTIKRDEGFSPVAFWDNQQATYGYGCKAAKVGDTITEAEAENLLWDEVEEAIKDFETLYYDCRDQINDVRAEALVQLCFNLGRTHLRGFRKMNNAIELNDWETAANELMDSKWYLIDLRGNSRAKRLVAALRNG